jgi:isopenicillin N synthase-like dioxygenase
MGLDCQDAFLRPPVVDRFMDALQDFARFISIATTSTLNSLSTSLELSQEENFMTYHRPSAASPDIIRLLKYHAQPLEERGVLHTPHTDLGSLTFLFTRQPGLQILAPDSDQWTWVEPKEGCAIVNLGDGMSLLTNGFLRSCLHRVGPLPDEAMPTRYSFAYLVRAEDQTPMTGLKCPLFPPLDPGKKVFTSGEWLKQKFQALRLNTRKENEDWILTGNREDLPT